MAAATSHQIVSSSAPNGAAAPTSSSAAAAAQQQAASHSTSSSSNVVGGNFRVDRKIGEGSFGVCFSGLNLLTQQTVAIKFVSFLALPLMRTRLESQAPVQELC